MTTPFRTRIQKALSQPTLQAALDLNTEKRKHAYQEGFASLPDAEHRRARARQIRADVVANLEQYLEQFTAQLKANGIQVHTAADAAEAVQIVLDLAVEKQAHLAVKAKTMVSEEIELNHALEAAGIRVMETDLGEFIVQLRGERPGHILTPAVHLRRGDVAKTFEEKLGIGYTEDVAVLTQAARAVLRQNFLNAEIGISGVNFGIAETGTLCILTNEGNGRMCTTVPPVHIALMGIERIVPTMADLGLMLSVLPRASTGQKITVYTNLIRAPRAAQDPDGPLERHVILVDNGRRKMRQSPLAEALYCIRCGACLNVCPVFREIGGHAYVGNQGQVSVYSGPIGSVVAPGLFGAEAFSNLARASSLCGACQEACPVGIHLPELLLRVRAGQTRAPELPVEKPRLPTLLAFGLKVYSWAAASPLRFHFAQKLAGWVGNLAGKPAVWMHLPAWTGWGAARDFPRPARSTFREQFHRNRGAAPADKLPPRDMTSRGHSDFAGEPQSAAAESAPDMSLEERISRLELEIQSLGGEVVRCTSKSLPRRISEVLVSEEITRLMTWNADFLPQDLLPALAEFGIACEYSPDPAIRAGLTGVSAAAAETGSLLLTGGPGKPLLASLLPEIHLAVVQADQIAWSIDDLLQNPDLRSASAAALVSGPSRTGDIELTLTIGVHGPGRVVVFLVESPGLASQSEN